MFWSLIFDLSFDSIGPLSPNAAKILISNISKNISIITFSVIDRFSPQFLNGVTVLLIHPTSTCKLSTSQKFKISSNRYAATTFYAPWNSMLFSTLPFSTLSVIYIHWGIVHCMTCRCIIFCLLDLHLFNIWPLCPLFYLTHFVLHFQCNNFILPLWLV